MAVDRSYLARIMIGLVTAWNLLAAVTFILWPASYVSAYELSGVPGETAVRGVGVLFLMWNVSRCALGSRPLPSGFGFGSHYAVHWFDRRNFYPVKLIIRSCDSARIHLAVYRFRCGGTNFAPHRIFVGEAGTRCQRSGRR